MQLLILIYGILAYLSFFACILYMIGFVSATIVPKTIDSGQWTPFFEAASINIALIAQFGLSHSVMARPRFKAWLTRYIPDPAERSTFVLTASLSLALLFWQWRPMTIMIWQSVDPLSSVLFAISMFGWVMVFWSSFLIDHFDLFGLRQVWLNFKSTTYSARPFVVRGLYKLVRHPLMLGFLIAFWFTPAMSAGHLLFAFFMTCYIFIGIHFEERDLLKHLGADYKNYKRQTSMVFPWKQGKN